MSSESDGEDMGKGLAIGMAGLWLIGCGSLSVVKQSAPLGSVPTDSTPASRSYPQPPEVIARASAAAMSSLGWEVDYAQSKPPHTIAASAPLSLWTGGDLVRAYIGTEPEGGGTTVRVTSSTNGQMYDWGKNEENIRRFFAALDSAVPLEGRDSAAGAKLVDIIVTAGPLSQPYTALGEVNVNTKGMVNLGSILNDTLFRSPLQRAIQGPTPTAHTETINKMLREKAREQYGNQVDAVVNVVYHTDPDGDVFASGLAVHFMEPQATPALTPTTTTRSLEERLKELRDLREKNLITPEEYYDKRSELLKRL
jgi:hypothetical protein